jgi:hypothetical protein
LFDREKEVAFAVLAHDLISPSKFPGQEYFILFLSLIIFEVDAALDRMRIG